jgi:hypothetical protein
VDPYESSLGPGGEDRHEGHPAEAPEGEDQIMSRLPRSRPPARSRASSGSARSRTASSREAPPSPAPRSESAPALDAAQPAPGLPRLALDGAIEAAKLPIKVGANITFRALDAVTKSLRGR